MIGDRDWVIEFEPQEIILGRRWALHGTWAGMEKQYLELVEVFISRIPSGTMSSSIALLVHRRALLRLLLWSASGVQTSALDFRGHQTRVLRVRPLLEERV